MLKLTYTFLLVYAGTCRTSFHPICAREARHRLEVWGKYGCNNVRLFSLFPRICNFAVVIVAYLSLSLAYLSDETFHLKWLCLICFYRLSCELFAQSTQTSRIIVVLHAQEILVQLLAVNPVFPTIFMRHCQ